MGLLDHPGYDVETDEGMLFVNPLDRLIAQDKSWRKMGVKNICPRCQQECAILLGDPNGEHWCLYCQIRQEAEELLS